MTRCRFALAALLALVVGGCAHTPLVCPRAGGTTWRQYDSPHFTVTTDLWEPRARELVGAFERSYRSFLDMGAWNFPERGEPPGRMRVIVFERSDDYAAIGPPHTDGFQENGSLVTDPAVIINNDGTHEPGEAFLHEMTHRLVRYYLPSTPIGLNEGLAEFYSTFTVRDGEALTGLPPMRLATLHDALPNVQTLFDTESIEGLSAYQANTFYLGAWFLVHTMALYYPQQLADMLAQMASGRSLREAYVASFGTTSWTQLEGRYMHEINSAYAMPGHISVQSWREPYKVPKNVGGVTNERQLNDGEVHLLWAALQVGRHDLGPQVALAEAHGADRAQLAFMRALLAITHKDLAAAEQAMTDAVAARPDDERYRLTLTEVRAAAAGGDEPKTLAAVAADMEWLAAHGTSSESRAVVSRSRTMRGDLASARAEAQRAIALDPTNPRAHFALATVDLRSGDLDGALAAAERALRLTPEGASTRATLQMIVALRARRRAMTPATPPAPARDDPKDAPSAIAK